MTNIYTKLLEVQKELGAIKKDATNPFFKSKYFDINSLLEQIKPVLNKHGLVVLQGLTNIDGKLALSTQLITEIQVNTKEESIADKIEFICPLPEVADPQKAGSAITYFRRYALQSLLALEAEDDDGNVASGKQEKIEPQGKSNGFVKSNAKPINNNDDIGF